MLRQVVQMLLARTYQTIDITLPNLRKVANLDAYGSIQILEELFDYYGADVMIAGGVLEAVAAKGTSPTMEFLLDKYVPVVQVTEGLVLAAAGNGKLHPGYRENMLDLVFRRWGNEVKITERIVKEVIKRGADGLASLFDRWDEEISITEDMLMGAIEHREAVSLMNPIVPRRRSQISISQGIAKAAVGHKDEHVPKDLVQLFLVDYGESWVTEHVIKAAIETAGGGGRETLRMLFEEISMKATLEMVQYTIEHQYDAVDILLIHLPSETLGEAARVLQDVLRIEDGSFLTDFLLENRGSEFEVSIEFLTQFRPVNMGLC